MASPSLGTEWVVDAHGCEPERLRSCESLASLFDRIVRELDLRRAGEPVWRLFPAPGGVTGLQLLMESHLACHTFPERGFAAFNLYCCSPRTAWPWAVRLREALGAQRVEVREISRGEP